MKLHYSLLKSLGSDLQENIGQQINIAGKVDSMAIIC